MPPTGEEIHLPGPSILPLLTAAGITLALVGVTTYWILSVAGGLLAHRVRVALDRRHAPRNRRASARALGIVRVVEDAVRRPEAPTSAAPT